MQCNKTPICRLSGARQQRAIRQPQPRQSQARLLPPPLAQLQPVIANLWRAEAHGQLAVSVSAIAWSYLHMHANRLLRSMQREQELVLYDLLSRHYEAIAARVDNSA